MALVSLRPFSQINQDTDWTGYNCSLNGGLTAFNNVSVDRTNFGYIFSSKLTTSKAIAYYGGRVQMSSMVAKVLNISGTTITPSGTETTITGSRINAIGATCIDSTRTLVLYHKSANTQNGLRIISESGGVLSLGAEFAVTGSAVGNPEVGGSEPTAYEIELINSTTALMVYKNTSGHLSARVVSFSGTTITSLGTPVTIVAATGTYAIKLKRFDTDRLLLTYAPPGSTVTASILDISSGTTVTVTTTTNIATGIGPLHVTMSPVSPTSFMVMYDDNNASFIMKANACTISGNTINVGTQTTLTSSTSFVLISHAQPVSSSQIMLFYHALLPSTIRYSKILTPSGLTFTETTECDISNSGDTNGGNVTSPADTWLEAIDTDRMLIVSRDKNTDPSPFSARILTV